MRVHSFVHSGDRVPQQLAALIRQHFGVDVAVVPSATEWEDTAASLEECCGDPSFCEDGDLLSELEDASSLLCSGIKKGDVVIVPLGQNIADFLIRKSVIDTIALVEKDENLLEQFGGVSVWGHTADKTLTKLYPK